MIPIFAKPGKNKPSQVYALLTLKLDVYVDLGRRAEKIESSAAPAKTWKAKIFLDSATHSPAYSSLPSLECRISLKKTTLSDFSSVSATNSRIWEPLWSEGRRKHCQDEAGRQLLSCSIPIDSMPSVEKLQQWALDSMRGNPSGAIGNSHGQLFIFARQYSQSGTRPLVCFTNSS